MVWCTIFRLRYISVVNPDGIKDFISLEDLQEFLRLRDIPPDNILSIDCYRACAHALERSSRLEKINEEKIKKVMSRQLSFFDRYKE